MASWTDGPEYAPLVRPDVFVEPDAPPLGPLATAPDAATSPTPGEAGRPERPSFTSVEAPALDAISSPAPPARDPQEAFDVATTVTTSSWSGGPKELAPPTGEPVALPPPAAVQPAVVQPAVMQPSAAQPAAMQPSAAQPAAAHPSAWGAAHAPHAAGAPPPSRPPWLPEQPFPPAQSPPPSHVPDPHGSWPPPSVNPGGFPPPGPPPWQQPERPPGLQPVTVSEMVQQSSPGVMIALGLGVLVPQLSVVLLVVASLLAGRIRYRRAVVGRMFSVAITVALVFGLIGMAFTADGFDPLTWYEMATGWAQLGDLVLLVAVPLVVGDAMRRGEHPEELL